MNRKYILSFALILLVQSCALYQPTDPNAPPTTPRDYVRKTVIAIHDGFYTPVSQELAMHYHRGIVARSNSQPVLPEDEWVVAHFSEIQRISEQYVRLKSEIGLIVEAWNAISSPITANEKIQELLELIGNLQRIQESSRQRGAH